jgi:uncharacterized SAM-binding protein YcdF (DUF218 family)
MSADEQAADLNAVIEWLARDDAPAPDASADTWVCLLGGVPDLSLARRAADLFFALHATRLLVVGGAGHSTARLRAAAARDADGAGVATEGRAEADILADVAARHWGVPRGAIIVERASTNCGNNATLALAAARAAADAPGGAPLPARLVLVQDPIMQRRSHESFAAGGWPAAGVALASAAPAVPRVAPAPGAGGGAGGAGVAFADAAHARAWPLAPFLELVMGEVPRLRDDAGGYGPRGAGFIGHVDVPARVLRAHAALLPALGALVRVADARHAAPLALVGGEQSRET